MYKNIKTYPMLGSEFALGNMRRREESATFKGTLIGILVSFLIIIFCAFLLNLASNPWLKATEDRESYYNGGAITTGGSEAAAKNNNISDKSRLNDGFVSFWQAFLGIKTVHAALLRPPSAQGYGAAQQGYAGQATKTDYKAQFFVNSAEKLELQPNEEVIYKIGFKNIGKAVWLNNGENFVSIYTFSPKYRKSDFQSENWYKNNQPAKLKEARVLPGQIGYIEFKLKAPQKAGEFTEIFKLAAENKAWIEGGEFSVPIIVKLKISPSSILPLTKREEGGGSNFQGELLLKSHQKVEAKAGEVVDLRFGFKNIGKVNWDTQGLIVPQEFLEDDGKSIFFYPTWPSGHQPTVSGTATKTGEIGFLDFKIKAPEAAGTYAAKFYLVANYSNEVQGSEIEIPVYVTDETAGADQSGRITQNINMTEPMMEVGLSYIENSSEAVELMSDQAYQMTDKAGTILASLSANEPVNITYNFSNKIFTIQNARLNFSTSGELHFNGLNNNTVFTILSMSRPYSGGWNDNKYRDEIILRQAETTGRLWTINRLPMEQYLWGIAETSNISPIEYIKSIIVAARTYALYHYLNPYKYNGYFTMRATTADQLYRGYNSELRSPRVAQAVNETKGQVVTYQKDVVVTPYFGHSDGKTRTWASVFGGKDKPWLQPVLAPYDAGLSMFGHGVGMSANDAYGHAKTDGWDYTRILKYYYNGIEVSKVY